MRWLFLLLLSANVGMLVWSVQQHKDVEPQLTKEAGVGNLRLVTQREQSLASIMPPADEGRDEPEPVLPEPEIAYATPDAEPAGSQTTDDVVQNDAETSTAEPGAALEPVLS